MFNWFWKKKEDKDTPPKFDTLVCLNYAKATVASAMYEVALTRLELYDNDPDMALWDVGVALKDILKKQLEDSYAKNPERRIQFVSE